MRKANAMSAIPKNKSAKPLRVGITGQPGFMGTHLFNWLGLFPERFLRIPFEDDFFRSEETLENWVSSCDVIVHLAAMNRHGDPEVIYHTNVELVRLLIAAMEAGKVTPHVIFSSSTQEERDNPYGKSKREGRELLSQWAVRNGAKFTGMIIPNVFGPFGHPYYNSVVATFCHQLTHDETPVIDIDGNLKLIYAGELVSEIGTVIEEDQGTAAYSVPHTSECKVSAILEILRGYKASYLENGIIPSFQNKFELNLFNTFRCFMDIARHYPVSLTKHSDPRGSFVETVKTNTGGQVSFSTTRPGITRGDHYHTRKVERFAVIKGKARIQLRRIGTGEVLNFDLDGENPSYVDMPVWYTHNITNTGLEDLYTIFWINELFNPDDPDTFFEKVER